MDMSEALSYMMQGQVASVDNGSFDYYVIDSAHMIKGMASCDPEHYEVTKEELQKIAQGNWYLVNFPTEKSTVPDRIELRKKIQSIAENIVAEIDHGECFYELEVIGDFCAKLDELKELSIEHYNQNKNC